MIPSSGLYVVTDKALSKKPTEQVVLEAITGGAKIIQYREKKAGKKELLETAEKLAELCRKHKTMFIINNRVDVCLAVNADGVHLGQDDFPFKKARKLLGKEKVIGLTVHNLEEARKAEVIGADYVGFSPVFETNTKLDAGKAAGVQGLKEVVDSISIPVVAIGGINEENLEQVLATGTRLIAMVSAVVGQEDVKGTCERIGVKINDFKK